MDMQKPSSLRRKDNTGLPKGGRGPSLRDIFLVVAFLLLGVSLFLKSGQMRPYLSESGEEGARLAEEAAGGRTADTDGSARSDPDKADSDISDDTAASSAGDDEEDDVPLSVSEAEARYRKAAEEGDPEAQFKLGME